MIRPCQTDIVGQALSVGAASCVPELLLPPPQSMSSAGMRLLLPPLQSLSSAGICSVSPVAPEQCCTAALDMMAARVDQWVPRTLLMQRLHHQDLIKRNAARVLIDQEAPAAIQVSWAVRPAQPAFLIVQQHPWVPAVTRGHGIAGHADGLAGGLLFAGRPWCRRRGRPPPGPTLPLRPRPLPHWHADSRRCVVLPCSPGLHWLSPQGCRAFFPASRHPESAAQGR